MEYAGEPNQLYESMTSAGTHKTCGHNTALVSMSAVCQPYIRRMSAVCQPWNGRMSAVYQPYVRRMSAVYQPYVSRISAVCQPYLISQFAARRYVIQFRFVVCLLTLATRHHVIMWSRMAVKHIHTILGRIYWQNSQKVNECIVTSYYSSFGKEWDWIRLCKTKWKDLRFNWTQLCPWKFSTENTNRICCMSGVIQKFLDVISSFFSGSDCHEKIHKIYAKTKRCGGLPPPPPGLCSSIGGAVAAPILPKLGRDY